MQWTRPDDLGLISTRTYMSVWCGVVMVMALDLRSRGHWLDFQTFYFRVTTLGKLFTHICLCTKQYNLVLVKERLVKER